MPLGFVGRWTFGRSNQISTMPKCCAIACCLGYRRHKKMNKYRSYGITISTVEPVEGEGQEALKTWLKKQDYAYAVIEGGEGKAQERHLHAQVWYKEPREKGTLNKALKRIIEKYFPMSKPHIAIKIKIAYNDDFLENYMAKDVTQLLLPYSPDELDRKDYYPSQEEQDKVMKNAKIIDHKMNHLEELFYAWVNETQEEEPDNMIAKKAQVSRFLSDMMYKSRKIKVPTDMKIQRNLCSVFTNYLWKVTNSYLLLSQEDQKLFEQEINNKNNND